MKTNQETLDAYMQLLHAGKTTAEATAELSADGSGEHDAATMKRIAAEVENLHPGESLADVHVYLREQFTPSANPPTASSKSYPSSSGTSQPQTTSSTE